MTVPVEALIRRLADGQFHDGQSLSSTISPAGLPEVLEQLSHWGLIVEAQGDGYRLASPISLLDARQISRTLSAASKKRIGALETVDVIDSTNSEIKRRNPESGQILLAELQTAGRGRQGRQWIAPFASGLCLSISWMFKHQPVARIAGASLALGVAVRRALLELGYAGVRLKWPNDLLGPGGKLGGILLEFNDGPGMVVAGIGINWQMPDAPSGIDQPWTDLASMTRKQKQIALPLPDRNDLAGRVIDHAVGGLEEFDQQGLGPFLDEWRSADALLGREIRVQRGTADQKGDLLGCAAGVDSAGALMVATHEGLQTVSGGEVQVRPT